MIQGENKLRLTLFQQDIAWEDKGANLKRIHEVIKNHASQTDLLVLPEMCTTGFTMNSANLSETIDGYTMTCLKQWALEYNIAICGSFIANENNKYYNRAFFITSETSFYYDKRHLFRMGSELLHFSPGKNKLIIEHNGFNICLLICYDLRFPVWSRNVDNEYDLLIYVANWPESRNKVWTTLLTARAIENMCFVCGLNRIGTDGNGLKYCGSSMLIDAKGTEISSIPLNQETTQTVCIDKAELKKFRNKFPVWKDADRFEIKE